MSSTPLLEKAATSAALDWVEIVSPRRAPRYTPNGAGIIVSIAELRHAIVTDSAPSLVIDTDSFREIDEHDRAAAEDAASRWDD